MKPQTHAHMHSRRQQSQFTCCAHAQWRKVCRKMYIWLSAKCAINEWMYGPQCASERQTDINQRSSEQSIKRNWTVVVVVVEGGEYFCSCVAYASLLRSLFCSRTTVWFFFFFWLRTLYHLSQYLVVACTESRVRHQGAHSESHVCHKHIHTHAHTHSDMVLYSMSYAAAYELGSEQTVRN